MAHGVGNAVLDGFGQQEGVPLNDIGDDLFLELEVNNAGAGDNDHDN
jgi:hypothetical protein